MNDIGMYICICPLEFRLEMSISKRKSNSGKQECADNDQLYGFHVWPLTTLSNGVGGQSGFFERNVSG